MIFPSRENQNSRMTLQRARDHFGTLNPETMTGVRHFQTLKGMRPTGTLAAGTLSALGVPPVG